MCVFGSGCDEKSCDNCKKRRHKHADVIKAWADGAKVQCRAPKNGRYDPPWFDIPSDETVYWSNDAEYRVKPEPKPDEVFYQRLTRNDEFKLNRHKANYHNCKIVFDGESGELKSVEII